MDITLLNKEIEFLKVNEAKVKELISLVFRNIDIRQDIMGNHGQVSIHEDRTTIKE